MKLLCPIQPTYLNSGHTLILNQLFGENLLTYSNGHTGIDIKTTGGVKYERTTDGLGNWEWNGSDWGPHARLRRIEATPQEENGRIPIVACHDGEVSVSLSDEKQRVGWGVYVTAEPEEDKQYRTLYWHIETPWNSLGGFQGVVSAINQLIQIFTKRKVKAGAIIAIAGNNGYSTGPHLHLELQVREKTQNGWGSWNRINAMPYFDDDLVVYQRYRMSTNQFFHKGKEISEAQYKKLIKSWPKVL